MNPAIRDPAEPVPSRKPRPPDLDWLNRLPLRDMLHLEPDRMAPRKARRHLADTLEKWSLQRLGISAPLVLSEIATNALAATNAVFAAHAASGRAVAAPPVTVWLYGWPSAVAMLAWDASSSPPEPQAAGPDDESGRGLAIIDLMSADWGYYFPAGIGGKITWAIVDKPLSAPASRRGRAALCYRPNAVTRHAAGSPRTLLRAIRNTPPQKGRIPCTQAVAHAGSRNSPTSR